MLDQISDNKSFSEIKRLLEVRLTECRNVCSQLKKFESELRDRGEDDRAHKVELVRNQIETDVESAQYAYSFALSPGDAAVVQVHLKILNDHFVDLEARGFKIERKNSKRFNADVLPFPENHAA